MILLKLVLLVQLIKRIETQSITRLALKDYLVWIISVVGVLISFPKIPIRFFHRGGQMMGKKNYIFRDIIAQILVSTEG